MSKYKYPTQRPYLSSFVILKRDGKIATVVRKNTGWMDGYYGLPSGKVEEDEQFTVCAAREAKEEVGVTVNPAELEYGLTMHRYEADETNWIDVFFVAAKWEGEPHNAEPEKSSKFEWLDLNNLPDNMVPNVRYAIEQIELGVKFCEYNWEKTK